MKPKFILCLALVLCGHTFAQDTTNSFHRISIAEVGSVRLEVEQYPNYENGVQIRVSDFAAQNWGKTNVACDFYWIDDNGKEAKEKFISVPLKQVSSNSREYSGSVSNRVEFEHGNIFKIVYKSDGLPLPISTWYACYYH
jgi:hypothetical protein